MSETFHIQGYEKPIGKTVLDICFHLCSTFQRVYETFAPDGTCFDQPTGIINYYPQANLPSIPTDLIKVAIERIGATVSQVQQDISRMSGHTVYRFHVTENITANIDTPPELSLTTASANSVCHVLRLYPNSSWSVDAILDAFASIKTSDCHAHARAPNSSHPVYSAGLDPDTLYTYCRHLKHIAQWAKQHGFSHIYRA